MTYITMRMQLQGDGLATRRELELRWGISDAIEESGVGEVVGGGSGFGEMDIGVEVADAETARQALREIAAEFGISQVTFD